MSPGDPFAELAARIHGVAERAAVKHRAAHTCKVVQVAPLRVESLDHDELALEEGDSDFTVEQAVYDYHERFGIEIDDLVKVTYDGTDYSATGVVSDKSVA